MTLQRLKALLLGFFIALCVPSSILVYQAYGQLKWEVFHQHQQLARELSLRIDARFEELIEREENRSFTDYAFLNVTGSEQAAFLQRSPLSQFPLESDAPGLLGYFQVDQLGKLQTPIVPLENANEYGIDDRELQQRLIRENSLRAILGKNRLVSKIADARQQVLDPVVTNTVSPKSELLTNSESRLVESEVVEENPQPASGLSVFDSLSKQSKFSKEKKLAVKKSSKPGEPKSDDSNDIAVNASIPKQAKRKLSRDDKKIRREKSLLLESEINDVVRDQFEQADSNADEVTALLSQQQVTRIRTFESEVEAFEFNRLDSGHFVLFRRVWNNNQRYVQGLLFEQKAFVDQLVTESFRQSSLASVSNLMLAHQGNVVRLLSADLSTVDGAGLKTAGEAELLYQTRLIAPFSDLQLIYSLAHLPVGAGALIVLWSSFVLTLVVVGGLFLFYRLGAGQIALAQQQQDFVSAVSHELKTPLTSIRMYGEMLREGWADDSRKKFYYDYIFNESERLSRLINNVLQLARLSRSEQKATMKIVEVDDLLRDLLVRLQSQLEQAKFTFTIDCEPAAKQSRVKIDSDWFTQIMINLVDNAIKFSSNAEQKKVELSCRLQQSQVVFSVRDYGPGIARDQIKRIFKLFYRSESELTRETVGTGIGLSLVQQLVTAMQGQVDVLNREPGAEFRVSFTVLD